MVVSRPHTMEPPLQSTRPVLVVDDDRLVLLTLSHGLRRAGFKVIEVDNGDDAILTAREHRPGVAVLDIRMQGLSGFDVAQHLKDYERIPFLFVSAYADDATRRQAAELGALACLGKPVDLERLTALVSTALDSAAEIDAGRPARGTVRTPMSDAAFPEAALAVGLLMSRCGVDRGQAWDLLLKEASRAGNTPEEAATALLARHEAHPGLPPQGGG